MLEEVSAHEKRKGGGWYGDEGVVVIGAKGVWMEEGSMNLRGRRCWRREGIDLVERRCLGGGKGGGLLNIADRREQVLS